MSLKETITVLVEKIVTFVVVAGVVIGPILIVFAFYHQNHDEPGAKDKINIAQQIIAQ